MGSDPNPKYWQPFGDNPDPCQKRPSQEVILVKLNIFQNKNVLPNFQLQEKIRLDFNFPFDCIETALYGLECFQYLFVFREIAKYQIFK